MIYLKLNLQELISLLILRPIKYMIYENIFINLVWIQRMQVPIKSWDKDQKIPFEFAALIIWWCL